MGELLAVLLGAACGSLVAAAMVELVARSPGLAPATDRLVASLSAALRAGEARTPEERRMLAALGAVGLGLAGLVLAGPGPATVLAVAGPGFVAWFLARRRARHRRAVAAAVPEIARSLSDSLTAGASLRGALTRLPESLHGPARIEATRLASDLETGLPTVGAIWAFRDRLATPAVDALATVLCGQTASGGDLAGLLRRHGRAAAEAARANADARAQTAQARFTGSVVAALPVGAAALAELLRPGFAAATLGDPAASLLVAVAVALQAGGFLLIGRLSRVVG